MIFIKLEHQEDDGYTAYSIVNIEQIISVDYSKSAKCIAHENYFVNTRTGGFYVRDEDGEKLVKILENFRIA